MVFLVALKNCMTADLILRSSCMPLMAKYKIRDFIV